MSYEGGWYIPCRVAEVRFWGPVTNEDLDIHTELCVKLLTEAQTHAPERRIHLLLDATEVTSLPPLYLMLPRALPVLRFKNRDMMFVITQKSTFRSIMEITAHVLNFSVSTFDSRPEAIQALEALMLKDELQGG